MPTTRAVAQKRKPRALTDRDVERIAEITALDVQHARAAWTTDAPNPYKRLLDAEASE